MNKRKLSSTLSLILAILLFAGCRYHAKDYSLVRLDRSGYDIRDTIHLSLEILDTTTLYDLHMSARVEKTFKFPTIDVVACIISPSGNESMSPIHIPADQLIAQEKTKSSSHQGVYDVDWKWAEGVRVTESGVWKINLLIKNHDGDGKNGGYTIKGIHEIGINCKPNERKR